MLSGEEKTSFHEKRSFFLPRTPSFFKKSEECFAPVCRKTADINYHNHTRGASASLCRRQKLHIAEQFFTPDAIRLFTSTAPVCRKTADINYHNHTRGASASLCRRQKLHIAEQFFTPDAIRLFTSTAPVCRKTVTTEVAALRVQAFL